MVLHVGHVGAAGFAGEITVGELDHRRADVFRLPCFVSLTRGSRVSVAEPKRARLGLRRVVGRRVPLGRPSNT